MANCPQCGIELFGGTKCYKCNVNIGAPSAAGGAAREPAAAGLPAAGWTPPPMAGSPAQFNPHQYQTPLAAQAPRSTNGLAIAGFVISLFFGIIGLVLSAIALSQINRTGQEGKGLAIAGIVIGAASTIIGVLWWGAILAAFSGSTY